MVNLNFLISILDSIINLIKGNPGVWLSTILLLLFILFHSISSKKVFPKLLDIRGILFGYLNVFPNKVDLVYILSIVILLTIITISLVTPDLEDLSKEYTQIGVILTLLVAAIIDIMGMAISKSESIHLEKSQDQSHVFKIACSKDIVRIGVFEILIGFLDLITIFLLGAIGSSMLLIFRFIIYALFYLFSFNILIVMHKLYLLYFDSY